MYYLLFLCGLFKYKFTILTISLVIMGPFIFRTFINIFFFYKCRFAASVVFLNRSYQKLKIVKIDLENATNEKDNVIV